MKVRDEKKILHHQIFQREVLPRITPLVELIQEKLRKNEPIEIIMSKHSRYREIKREISYRTILNVICTGKIIEYQGNENKRDEVEECQNMELSDEECINVILMKKIQRIGKKSQYVHVCVNIQGDSIVVKTVYDPSTKYWQWTNHYSTRVFHKYIDRYQKHTPRGYKNRRIINDYKGKSAY